VWEVNSTTSLGLKFNHSRHKFIHKIKQQQLPWWGKNA